MDDLGMAREVVAFWRECEARWFSPEPGFDALCRTRYRALHERAAAGDLAGWAVKPEGALAMSILLDQLPRNMFRGTPRAFATDPDALDIAERAIAIGFDAAIGVPMRQFVYLPLMHAEKPVVQARSVALYEAMGDAESLRFARHHHDIVQRFGRFPHRNAILGRTSTPEECAFLEQDGFRG